MKEKQLVKDLMSKCIVAFDYFGNAVIVLPAVIGGVSIASCASVIGMFVGIASASFSFAFSLTTGIMKKLLKTTQNEKNAS